MPSPIQFLVCDQSYHIRRLAADVLVGAGFERVAFAVDGHELLEKTVELAPRIVLTSSRLNGRISGLHYTRKIRAGYENVKRTLSIIAMSDTPTRRFINVSRECGIDEILARPFTGAALLARVEAVIVRPRRFIESLDYVGPCRRRRMLEDFNGPMRRFTDPLESASSVMWEVEANREVARQCVAAIVTLMKDLPVTDRRRLRELYDAISDAQQNADDMRDQAMGDAARSLQRYITALGAAGGIDIDVLRTHIDAMRQMLVLGASDQEERERLVRGLVAIVDKRIRAKDAA